MINYNKLDKKKTILDSFRPLPSDLVKNLEEWFKIELTYTSNAIEGNTLTRKETALVINKGLTVGGKALIDHLEAVNHAKAIDYIENLVRVNTAQLLEKNILTIHELILKGIDDHNAGYYRSVAVRISGSRVILPNPVKVPSLMQEFHNWLLTEEKIHIVEKAALAHYKLVTIHPFTDGNGRTARLLMNLILMQNGFPPAIISNKDRLKYINALEKAQLGGSLEDFLKIIYNAVEHSLNIYIKALQQPFSNTENSAKLLKISEFASSANINVVTVRYWTKLGLLEAADYTESNYALYSDQEIVKVKKIQELQDQRYSLKEIKNFLTEL